MTIRQFKKQCTSSLKNSPSPSLDIDVLLMHALEMKRTVLLLNRDFEIPSEKLQWLLDAVSKRQQGLPIAYITGHKEFYGYDFLVTPDVLIPKPDTEILVERAIDLLIEKIPSSAYALTVCDMCTGSGCVALSVLRSLIDTINEHSLPHEMIPEFTLCDISDAALCMAKKNAETLIPADFLRKVRFYQSDLFAAVPQKFDAILSNPPYIPHDVALDLLSDGRSEPLLALDGDALSVDSSLDAVLQKGVSSSGVLSDGILSRDGLVIPKRLLHQAPSHLKSQGFVLMECGEYNIKAAADFASENTFSVVKIHNDLEGQMRVLELAQK